MELLILILATWRITSLLNREHGPWDILGRWRHLIGIRTNDVGETYGINELARLVDCPWCLSPWVAGGLALSVATDPVDWALTMLALSAGTIMIDNLVSR